MGKYIVKRVSAESDNRNQQIRYKVTDVAKRQENFSYVKSLWHDTLLIWPRRVALYPSPDIMSQKSLFHSTNNEENG